jgi:hypothetical protein
MWSDEPANDLKKALTFYASFDEQVRADLAGGEKELYTRSPHPTEKGQFLFQKGFDEKIFRIAKGQGISGGALEVIDVLPKNGRVYFPALKNIAFDSKGWGGAISIWCKTDPNKLLKTKFCDPIQITQKGANNGGIWFDFNEATPRDMRHGAFTAVPEGKKGVAEKDPNPPLVKVPKVDWKADEWHHVVISWSDFDTDKKAKSQFYVDGKLIGEINDRPIAMKWELEKTGIYIGIDYIGLLDEFAIFNRALTEAEVKALFSKPNLLK